MTVVALVPEVGLDATGVHRDLAVLLYPHYGTIDGLSGAAHAPADAVRLPRTALAPGFVNGHSHSFQRDLRGRVERVSKLAPDTAAGGPTVQAWLATRDISVVSILRGLLGFEDLGHLHQQ